MSKAEERAQAYENGLDYYHYTSDNPSVAYKAGYEQAEKDLALTWEDVKLLLQIVAKDDWYDFEISNKLWSQEFYEEVARRFNETRRYD